MTTEERIEQMWEDGVDRETILEFCMDEGRKDLAQEEFDQMDVEVEDRVYLADKHNLKLAECDEEWARREHAHYLGGMPVHVGW